jgi:hypothetical protein
LSGSKVQDRWRWRRPAETAPGWPNGLSIWIPDGEIVDIPTDCQAEEGVLWLPPFEGQPGVGLARRSRAA